RPQTRVPARRARNTLMRSKAALRTIQSIFLTEPATPGGCKRKVIVRPCVRAQLTAQSIRGETLRRVCGMTAGRLRGTGYGTFPQYKRADRLLARTKVVLPPAASLLGLGG